MSIAIMQILRRGYSSAEGLGCWKAGLKLLCIREEDRELHGIWGLALTFHLAGILFKVVGSVLQDHT